MKVACGRDTVLVCSIGGMLGTARGPAWTPKWAERSSTVSGFRGQMLEPDSCAQRGKGWEPVAENSAGHGLLIKSVTLGKLALCAFFSHL